MISADKAFGAQLSLYMQQVKKQKVSALSLCLKDVGKSLRSSQCFKYFIVPSCQGLVRSLQTGSVTENLAPCVTFMANPFMDVDISKISEQIAEPFCLLPECSGKTRLFRLFGLK